jgi:signal transduction histidine kinase/CheY-like chemotaxis protein
MEIAHAERKRLEATEKLNADRLASAFESMQEGVAVFDKDRRLVLCNAALAALSDAKPADLIGKSYEELLDRWLDELEFENDEQRRRHRAERLRITGTTRAFEVKTRDDRTLRVADCATPDGGFVRTVWDLTEDQRRTAKLLEGRKAAEVGSAAKSDFLSSMSHELRTPLNAILGFAQLLRRDKKTPLAPRHRERVDQILKGGEHLLRLIDDVLDLSRIEAGAVSVSTEPVDVRDAIEEVRRTFEPVALRQGLALEVAPLPDDLPLIQADRTRFVQILMNFGSNAIKYNRPGGSITLVVTYDGSDRVRVTVRDTGVGIPPDKHGKLFQPFQRAGQEMGPIEGTGIGLMITKRLAELMKGCVGFRSVVGEGSDFWVELPVHTSEARVAPPTLPPDPSTVTLRESASERLVLYVEDNPANVVFMHDLVSTLDDVELVSAPTAEIGIEIARARHPAVVIFDINLPGMSGIEALKALRASPETKDTPVIALTAAASERDVKRGLEEGFYRYLTKPVKVDELVDAIESLLDVPAA